MLIMSSEDKLEIGKRYDGNDGELSDHEGNYREQPFVVIGLATKEEWIAQQAEYAREHPTRKVVEYPAMNREYFYKISID